MCFDVKTSIRSLSTVIAVSYTHLDVYKRQDNASVHKANARSGLSGRWLPNCNWVKGGK